MSERAPHGPNKVYYANGRPDHYQPKPEISALTPGEQARMEFFREIFEVGRRTYEKESRDASATQQRLGLRAVDVLNEVLEKPFNIPRHVQNVDAYSRQKLGLEGQRVPLRNRLLRIYGNVAVGSVATGIDWMDLRIKKNPGKNDKTFLDKVSFGRKKRDTTESLFTVLLRSAKDSIGKNPSGGAAPAGGEDQKSGSNVAQRGGISDLAGAYNAGLEYLLDEVVSKGADTLVQTLTKSRASYTSPLAHKIYNISRLMPVADEFLNPTAIESVFRILSNYPVLGAPVEALYRYMNDQLRQQSSASKFTEGLAFSMVRGQKGYMDEQRNSKEEAERKKNEKGLSERINAIELQATVQAINQGELAKAVVTGQVPDELRRVVVDQISAHDKASNPKIAAVDETPKEPENPAP